MKCAILLSLFAVCTSGFVISPRTSSSTMGTAAPLNAATSLRPQNDWSNKPMKESYETVPVAKNAVSKRERSKMKDVILPPDYFLAWSTALLGPLIWWYHPCK